MGRQRQSDRANRQQQLLQIVAGEQDVRVGQLSERLRVSEVTIRADLRDLEATGRLRRVWGGARPLAAGVPAATWQSSSAVARMAVALVRSGDTLVLDGAELAAELATALVERADLSDLTVVTTSLAACMRLSGTEDRFDLRVLGGRLVNDLLVPDPALGAQMWWELGLLTCHRIDRDGTLWQRDADHAHASRQVLAATRRRILVVDHDLDSTSGGQPCGELAEIDTMILSSDTDRAVLDRLPLDGVQVLVAG